MICLYREICIKHDQNYNWIYYFGCTESKKVLSPTKTLLRFCWVGSKLLYVDIPHCITNDWYRNNHSGYFCTESCWDTAESNEKWRIPSYICKYGYQNYETSNAFQNNHFNMRHPILQLEDIANKVHSTFQCWK